MSKALDITGPRLASQREADRDLPGDLEPSETALIRQKSLLQKLTTRMTFRYSLGPSLDQTGGSQAPGRGMPE